MKNKTCLITGATSGIGRAAAIRLAKQGYDLILVGRNRTRGKRLRQQILRWSPGVRTEFHPCDISSMAEVRRLAEHVSEAHTTLDVLINNAGLRIDHYQESVDGIELTFATNHLGHFLLTTLVLPSLEAAPAARIITVSSSAHTGARRPETWVMKPNAYDRRQAYARSKLANLLFSFELARRLHPAGITANAVHPGLVASRFASNNGLISWGKHLAAHAVRKELIMPHQGADTLEYLASSSEVSGCTGRYFYRRQQHEPAPLATNPELARELWEKSALLCGPIGRLGSA